ncbi:hypothetical protein Pint_31095 [Pistacia integerrima]|uniref:Uncharacterized protein n=2 Tax=Pistacia TaxID=55512 RepID=A0ACC0XN57_9ROSI|nr:hypothetical protein Pint_31095 [Pistacia integerrima]
MAKIWPRLVYALALCLVATNVAADYKPYNFASPSPYYHKSPNSYRYKSPPQPSPPPPHY